MTDNNDLKKQADSNFSLSMLIIFVVIVCLIFVAAYVGSEVITRSQTRHEPQEAIDLRTRPVAMVQVAASAAEAGIVAAPAPAPVAKDPRSGEEVYNMACVACHAAGVLNAPKLGDKAAWEPRYAQGIATLLDHALNGFKAMPARGGNASLSDQEVENAIKYMLEKSDISVSDS